jgi:hypothetical protein
MEAYKKQYHLMLDVEPITSPKHLSTFLSLSPGRPKFTGSAKKIEVKNQDRCHELSDFYLFTQIIDQFKNSEDSAELHTNLSKLPEEIFGPNVVNPLELKNFKTAAANVVKAYNEISNPKNRYYFFLPNLDADVTKLNQIISSFRNNLRAGHKPSNASIQEAIDPCPKPQGEKRVLSFAAARLFPKTLNLLNKGKSWNEICEAQGEDFDQSQHFDVVQHCKINENGELHGIDDKDYIYVKTSDTTKYTTPISQSKEGNHCYVYRIKRKKNHQGFFEVEG